MSQEIVKFVVNNGVSLEYSCDVKEEFQDEYYPDNKVCVSETAITDTINIDNTEINYTRHDFIEKYGTLSVDLIKTDLLSSEVNDIVSNNVNREDGICPDDIQIKFCNELLFCNHCQEVYQDYCTECRVLVHILNRRPCYNTSDRIRELPEYILEARESIGHLAIFSLKVIPENVIFGPFTGLNSTGLPLRIKGGRFVINDDKLEHLNWMQFINPARNISEQNLFPYQHEDKLYYCTTRRIQEEEELLVYFGEEYKDNLLKNVEMDFIPITREVVENVFACIYCCLGFSSMDYLSEHKAVYHSENTEMFSVEELAQCPFCKIYLGTKEYFEHHMDYCCEANARDSILPTPKDHEVEVDRRPSIRSKVKRWKRRIYKCRQCKFKTIYNADFRRHANEHYKVKMYKCGICDRRYKGKKLLKTHVENIHINNEGRDIQKYSACDYSKAIQNKKERSTHSQDGEKQCLCTKCKFQTRQKPHLRSLIKTKDLNRDANCEFKTDCRTYLKRHKKINHLIGSNYKCAECEFETKHKSTLGRHKNAKHLKVRNYKCTECEYKAYRKYHLEVHVKGKHLNLWDYKCMECEYQTNRKSSLKGHIETKHLKRLLPNGYKCMECEYQTNRKSSLKRHIETKHLKRLLPNGYKCMECEYQTNRKSTLETHMKTKHLQLWDYKCMECEFQTNQKSHLEVHIKSKHLKLHDYECMKCGYKTNYKRDLERHMKRKHLNSCDYKCLECEFQTDRKPHFEIHIKSKHLKLHDYKCMECKYQTNWKSHLERHIKARHIKLRDYKCVECEYQTNHKTSLEVHIKSKHLKSWDYKCMECEYQTNYKVNLEMHVKSRHLKSSDYKCMECEYQTYRKSYLKMHMKTKHLKLSDYKCVECEYQTSYKSNLEKHIKGKHLKTVVTPAFPI